MSASAWTSAAGPADGTERAGCTPERRVANSTSTAGVPPVLDIRLGHDGTLGGLVRDELGRPRPNTVVMVFRDRQVVACARTDVRGTYRVTGLRGGVYRIQAGKQVSVCRLWSAATAPPQAGQRLDIDTSRVLARGQSGEDGDRNDAVHRFGLDGVGGLDPFELTMLTTSITSLTLSAVMLSNINELQETVDRLPGSP